MFTRPSYPQTNQYTFVCLPEIGFGLVQFSSVQSLSRVQLLTTPWVAARQASLSITNSWSSLMSIESVMPSSQLIFCCPLLLLPPIPPSIRVFSNESSLHMTWPKYWSFSFSIIPVPLDIYPREMKTSVHTNTCPRMFIAILFIITPNCQTT